MRGLFRRAEARPARPCDRRARSTARLDAAHAARRRDRGMFRGVSLDALIPWCLDTLISRCQDQPPVGGPLTCSPARSARNSSAACACGRRPARCPCAARRRSVAQAARRPMGSLPLADRQAARCRGLCSRRCRCFVPTTPKRPLSCSLFGQARIVRASGNGSHAIRLERSAWREATRRARFMPALAAGAALPRRALRP